jgi:hypothetical protein
MKTIIAGLILSLAVALVPVPRITVQNPTLLYAAAMYKTAVGDTQSALRLMQRAEQAQQPAADQPEHPKTAQSVCDRSTNL